MFIDNETIYKQIKESIYKDDIGFNESIISLYNELNKYKRNYRSFNDWKEYWINAFEQFLDTNFNTKEKIVFLLRSCLNENLNIPNNFKKYVFSNIIRRCIIKYKNEIIDIFKDGNIQIMYSNWFKINETSFNETDKIYKDIFKLPKFKEIILSDYSFVIDLYQYNFDDRIQFIPKDLGYLIGTINSYSLSRNELFKLYNKYFNKLLNGIEIFNLVCAHKQFDEYNRLLNNDTKYKKLEYVSTLKDIFNNKEYYKLLQKLSKKFDISLKDIMLFASKYKNTALFLDLYTIKYNKEISKKIKYLANSKPIIDKYNIKSLNDIKLSDLINLEKQEDIKVTVYGGPNSTLKRKTTFFKDSNNREIRRVNVDGTYKINGLSDTTSHFEGVKNIYNDYNISKDFTASIDIALEMIKRINSMTFIIEKEICFIIMPNKISLEQKDIFLNWLLMANKKGKLGIVLYNNETNKKEIISNEVMNTNEIIDYINNLDTNKTR